tara:strand:- start:1254 stop:2042 length:789 start_codon:yes stop_codon:yes gene_type:complete
MEPVSVSGGVCSGGGGAQAISKAAAENFVGWHYTGCGRVQRTALAVVPSVGLSHDAIEAGKVAMGGTVHDLRKRDSLCRYVKTLHNNGVTLQQRAENMVLTRPLRVLVKGSSVCHVATVCDVSSHAVTTAAHALVEHTAVNHVIDEAVKRGPGRGPGAGRRDLLSKLCGSGRRRGGCGAGVTESMHLRELRAAPTFKKIFELCGGGSEQNVHPCVLLTQATAVIITAYEDAGSKFRDRASRMEAARHHGMAVQSVLGLAVSS